MERARRISEQYSIRRRRVRGLAQAISQLSIEAEKRALGPIDFEYDNDLNNDGRAKVRLWSVAPAIGGFDLLARIDHLENGRLYIRPMGEVDLDFAEIRRVHGTKRCDHCGVRRARRVVYILRRQGQASEVQVGSSCLAAYVGDSNSRKALLQADLFSQARELVGAAVGMEPQDSPRKVRAPEVDDYLAHVAAVIRSQGGHFVRKVDVDSEEMATAVIALENYRLQRLGDHDEEGRPRWVEVGEKERQLVDRMTREFRSLTAGHQVTGYDRALLTALNKELAWPDKQGILATLFGRVQALRKERGDSVRPDDPWVGEVGERVDVVAVLQNTGKSIESEFGPQVPHYFVTDDGKRITWFATNKQLEPERTYRIRGKVKRHDTFRGLQSTVLTDCRAVPGGNEVPGV
ncbi:MAG: hypothetical protein J0H98_11850 [Solirubrobacterales bacterium]|nr:hypothetical protein [Solirubrobacterales bacterium]